MVWLAGDCIEGFCRSIAIIAAKFINAEGLQTQYNQSKSVCANNRNSSVTLYLFFVKIFWGGIVTLL